MKAIVYLSASQLNLTEALQLKVKVILRSNRFAWIDQLRNVKLKNLETKKLHCLKNTLHVEKMWTYFSGRRHSFDETQVDDDPSKDQT